MKKLISIILLIVMMVGCGGVAPIINGNKNLIRDMGSSTVALVMVGEETRVYCTGVWVSELEILTAKHCIQLAANYEANTEEDIDPVGAKIHFSLEEESMGVGEEPSGIHLGRVIKVDKEHDLGLVRIEGENIIKHSVVRIARERPAIGERIHIVGHVKGLYWSYIEGIVSAYRKRMPESKRGGPFMQMSAPVYYGNSGGGVFNDRGELCGIVSFMTSIPMTNFAIEIGEIKRFMGER